MSKKNNKREKVIIALSGGVDSAVAAAILKERGFDVIGVHFWLFGKTWKFGFQVEKIARKLGISLKVVDARKEFKKRIIDYFLDAYKKGLTPNPCVHCNKEIKFRLLFDLMKKEKADYVATGHYSQIKVRPFPSPTFRRGIPQVRTLCEAKDKTKDQSYFLHKLTQQDLAKIIFPLGDYKKTEVKKMAQRLKLPTLEKESQDICFLAGQSVEKFLGKKIKAKAGEIREIGPARKSSRAKLVLRSDMGGGKILGIHKGLPFYTIGQRKGIGIGGASPLFVIGKNVRKNELLVTREPEKLLTKKFFVNRVNWVYPHTKNSKKRFFGVGVKIRYRAEKVSAIIKLSGKSGKSRESGKLIIETKKPLRAVTPGQAAVFYWGAEVLGGGEIL